MSTNRKRQSGRTKKKKRKKNRPVTARMRRCHNMISSREARGAGNYL